jgi:XTP/dITP diphosphohydrolase
MKIVLATKNRSKVEEIRYITRELPLEILTLQDFPAILLPPEDGSTFKDNALKKARFVAGETGLTALADDSGLEVNELDGRPGIRSSRYAGAHATDGENIAKLLKELEEVPITRRTARFVSAIALVEPSGKETVFEGVLEGLIGFFPKGARGFGYDPIFIVPELGKTTAELKPEEKNRISHRGRALEKLKAWLLQDVSR